MKFVVPRQNASAATARGNYHAGPWPFDREFIAASRRHPQRVNHKRSKRRK